MGRETGKILRSEKQTKIKTRQDFGTRTWGPPSQHLRSRHGKALHIHTSKDLGSPTPAAHGFVAVSLPAEAIPVTKRF